jgi:hypothetical protein
MLSMGAKMAIKPIQSPNVEIRCTTNDDGAINAGSYADGQQLADSKYAVQNGTCDDIRRIHKQLQNDYPGVPINVGKACAHCITEDDRNNGGFHGEKDA